MRFAVAAKLCDSGADVVLATAEDDPDAERARQVLIHHAVRPDRTMLLHAAEHLVKAFTGGGRLVVMGTRSRPCTG